jgi:hypothetical protein
MCGSTDGIEGSGDLRHEGSEVNDVGRICESETLGGEMRGCDK